jgi:hypothetical protein
MLVFETFPNLSLQIELIHKKIGRRRSAAREELVEKFEIRYPLPGEVLPPDAFGL